VSQLKVTPEYLDRLKDALTLAEKSLTAGFEAPIAVGDIDHKMQVTHGLTGWKGRAAIMTVMVESRGEVHAHLVKVIDACKKALDAAKTAYASTDESSASVLGDQIGVGR
jgi:hypothetical protein